MDFDSPSASLGSAAKASILPAVYIVGAGPGDPELLTVKALKLIQQADVLVYANSLVPQQILLAMRPDAEKIATANMTLEAIVPLMIDRVRAGKSVVRLHSGDPSLYSAIHEQMLRLSEADVPFEVVPGISAFQAAAAKLKVELTVPAQVQSIILARIGGRTQVPKTEELAGLAAHKASLCLYLSARHVKESQAQLMMHYSPQTPVAICFRVGWPDEQIWVVPLEKMAEVSEAENLVRTTLYIVSPALAGAMEGVQKTDTQTEIETVRSRLYNPTHDHLFRPNAKRPKEGPEESVEKEQERAKR
ncbi:MAG: precorrin-4 C11-methyltransferase CobM [Phormidesmis priestleyi Ana]|uniref:Precorrin-4 C11-methyltransferase CobM n=1 Tax=Phormidesmis priestleyi Ana TaxID=1666911 RepID=A0A0P7ZMB2_9CYAN|nr:MAG: precorrin-4 C11-methyltransferase CobM [Phormidesmis priestleyi Ana]